MTAATISAGAAAFPLEEKGDRDRIEVGELAELDRVDATLAGLTL